MGTNMEHQSLLRERVVRDPERKLAGYQHGEAQTSYPSKKRPGLFGRVKINSRIRQFHDTVRSPKEVGRGRHRRGEAPEVSNHRSGVHVELGSSGIVRFF